MGVDDGSLCAMVKRVAHAALDRMKEREPRKSCNDGEEAKHKDDFDEARQGRTIESNQASGRAKELVKDRRNSARGVS